MSSRGVDREPPTTPNEQVLFAAGTHGYAAFRIPALVTSGTHVLAFCEGRRDSAGDTGRIDLVVRHSPDSGATWGPLTVVTRRPDHTTGNPMPFVTATGEIVLLTMTNGASVHESELMRPGVPEGDRRRVWVQHAPGPGQPFGPPVEVTDQVRRSDWGWFATGPGHGLTLAHGPERGRLIAACTHSILAAAPGDHSYGGHLMLSDDGGHTWRVGAVDSTARPAGAALNPNEATAAELPDGVVYVNARNQASAGGRLGAWSDDGGESLRAPFRPHPDLPVPAVQGSVLANGSGTLWLSTPGHPDERRDVTLWRSDDSGAAWRRGPVLHAGPGAYSDLALLADGTPAALVEAGSGSAYESIRFIHPTRTEGIQ
ncbi:exo-alpha-sialidase [Occultella glacieicola]|uniref:exo-alpha-sialidase n=1 Tax=Occultella glacieicola TaxID=2518684 RepID=A0ABY2E4F2_9MICO|nr:sialidase family protein [Occultella glacieicola]TDE94909.1 exo-alpha-sialidase [Occultella glacieicola]